MPYPKGTKIKCRPCTRKKERLIARNANNFTSEHVESEQHEEAMADWRTVFPTLMDKKYLFIVLTPEEHAAEVEIEKDRSKSRKIECDEILRKSPNKTKFSSETEKLSSTYGRKGYP